MLWSRGVAKDGGSYGGDETELILEVEGIEFLRYMSCWGDAWWILREIEGWGINWESGVRDAGGGYVAM